MYHSVKRFAKLYLSLEGNDNRWNSGMAGNVLRLRDFGRQNQPISNSAHVLHCFKAMDLL
jgi:hypothetical protein